MNNSAQRNAPIAIGRGVKEQRYSPNYYLSAQTEESCIGSSGNSGIGGGGGGGGGDSSGGDGSGSSGVRQATLF